MISEVPPEVLTQFSAESMEETVRADSNHQYEKMLSEVIEGIGESNEMGGVEA